MTPPNPPEQTPEVKTPRTDAFFNRKPKPGDKPFLQEVRDTMESFERENARLRAELEEARKDKVRLDWLIAKGPPGAEEDGYGLTGEIWDVAIDYAVDHEGTDVVAVRKAIDLVMPSAAALERKGAQGK